MMKLELRELTEGDEQVFQAAVDEIGQSDPDWVFDLGREGINSFKDYVELMRDWKKGKRLPTRFVPSTLLVATIGEQIMGRVSIRHELNEFLTNIGGHVGYAVIPSMRKKGYGTEILRQSLDYCLEDLGLDRVLVTCDDTNIGSRKIIENCGGVYENTFTEGLDVPKLRYWIKT